MPEPVPSKRIVGAVLLVNDVLSTHSEPDARRLYPNKWRQHVSETGDHLDNSVILADAEKSSLLIETIDRVCESVKTNRERRAIKAARLRFGVDDGQFRTLEETARAFNPKITPDQARKLISQARLLLRITTRARYFQAFYDDSSAESLRRLLTILPEPGSRLRF